jgi:hypothetical protein
MAVAITSSEVKAGFSTTVVDAEIDQLIIFINGADICLDKNLVSDNNAKLLKIYGVRHLLTLQANAGLGTVKSQGAPSGASRSFNSVSGATEEILSTFYGKTIKQMDKFGCLPRLLRGEARANLIALGGV